MSKRWNSTLNRNKPLKAKKGLERRTPLKASKSRGYNSTLRPVGDKQAVKNDLWGRITDRKCKETGFICLWCGKAGQRHDRERLDYLNGHHARKPRYKHNKPKFCYPAHQFKCHQEIDDNNVDVERYPNREAWLNGQRGGNR